MTTHSTTCQWSGCKAGAAMTLHSLVGNKTSLRCCAKHAPKWAREGTPSAFERMTGKKAYRVERIETATSI